MLEIHEMGILNTFIIINDMYDACNSVSQYTHKTQGGIHLLQGRFFIS